MTEITRCCPFAASCRECAFEGGRCAFDMFMAIRFTEFQKAAKEGVKG